MRHLAPEAGIAVVTVPARGTSRHCPHCLTPLRHRKAPDRPTATGWKWALRPHPECGWQGDRDTGAWLGVPPLGEHRRTRPDPPGQDHATGTLAIRSVLTRWYALTDGFGSVMSAARSGLAVGRRASSRAAL
ncbi:zinc ribbon domain-containing protein [Streptomyces sp. NPDC002671]